MRRDVSQPEDPRHRETVSFASHVCPVLGRLSLFPLKYVLSESSHLLPGLITCSLIVRPLPLSRPPRQHLQAISSPM